MSNTGTVTSLTYSFFDATRYRLDADSGVSLSSLNKSLLYLFNNDIWLYSRLNGKYKGLWWKSWYDGRFDTGYDSGDIITSNNVGQLTFIRKNWKAIKRLVNSVNFSDPAPDFNKDDRLVVDRYIKEVGELFHLGNSEFEQQLHISLADDNKEDVSNEYLWQPYLVTSQELSKKAYLLESLFQNAVTKHDSEYHTGLDALDEADKEFELGKTDISVYDSELRRYLPKSLLEGENDTWLNFVSKSSGLKLLAFGAMPQDFLHLVKPLGDSFHRIETWVRSDGYVQVKGYVPTAFLTEIIPDEGTIEYNWWRMGGMRNYALRLDYPINTNHSKLFFTKKVLTDSVTDDLISGSPVKVHRADTTNSISTSSFDIDKLTDLINQLSDQFDGFEALGSTTPTDKPEFPNENDAWAKVTSMKIPEGYSFPDALNDEKLETTRVSIMFNPTKICTSDEIVSAAFKESSAVNTLYHPSHYVSSKVGYDALESGSSFGDSYWTVRSDSTSVDEGYEDEPKDPPTVTRTITLILSADTTVFTKLLKNCNANSITEGKSFTELLNDCTTEGLVIDEVDTEITEYVTTGKAKYEKLTVTPPQPTNITIPAPVVPDPAGPAPLPTDIAINPPKPTIDKVVTRVDNAKLVIRYQAPVSILGHVELKNVPDGLSNVTTITDDLTDLVQDYLDDASELSVVAYRILINSDSVAIIIFFPNNCKDSDGNLVDILHIKDSAPGTEVEPGDFDLIEGLFKDYSPSSEESSDGSSIIYTFRKEDPRNTATPEDLDVDTEVEIPGEINFVDDITDPSVVSSNLRLIREFGITSSPVLTDVTHAEVLPAGNDLLLPGTAAATVRVDDWNLDYGQLAIFRVPSGCTDLGFEIAGMARSSEFETLDSSIYQILNDSGNLRWADPIIFASGVIARVKCAVELNRLDGSTLARSMEPMLQKLWSTLVDRKFFVNHIQLRNLDIEDFANLCEDLTDELPEDYTSDIDNWLRDAYEKFGELHKALFQASGLFILYKHFSKDTKVGDDEAFVKRCMVLRVLKSIEVNSITEEYLVEMRDRVSMLLGTQKPVAAEELGMICDRLETALSAWREIKEAVDSDSSEVSGDTQTEIAQSLLTSFIEGDLSELSVYCSECGESMTEIESVKAKLEGFLATKGIGERLKSEINYRLTFLKDYANRWVKVNSDVTEGLLRFLATRKIMYNPRSEDAQRFTEVEQRLNETAESIAGFMGRVWSED